MDEDNVGGFYESKNHVPMKFWDAKIKVRFLEFLTGIIRAYGGCLGFLKAMKDAAWRRYDSGRCLATFDPDISEWGNPVRQTLTTDRFIRQSIPWEVKHFSTTRKINKNAFRQ